MLLTPLALDLVQPVRDVLLQVQATIITKPRFEAATSTRHFSIAVSDYVTSVLMVEFLRKLQRQSPWITCELRPVGRRATEDLESGELDFLIAPELYASVVHLRIRRPPARSVVRRHPHVRRVEQEPGDRHHHLC
jgi:DNA-binding transcriptional LysR family regulator